MLRKSRSGEEVRESSFQREGHIEMFGKTPCCSWDMRGQVARGVTIVIMSGVTLCRGSKIKLDIVRLVSEVER